MQDEDQLSLRQADQIRGDLYALQDDLDFIRVQLARLPTRNEVWRAAMLGMLGGAVAAVTPAARIPGAQARGAPAPHPRWLSHLAETHGKNDLNLAFSDPRVVVVLGNHPCGSVHFSRMESAGRNRAGSHISPKRKAKMT